MNLPRSYARKISLLLIGLALLASPLFAKRLPVTIFTSANGLGSGFVDYIYRDSRGFMWFCTRDGLSRYDGSRFVTYRIGDTSSPPGIEVIFETREGEYYVSTTGGTFRLRPDIVSDNRSSFDRAMSAEFVFGSRGSFLEDRNGRLWFNNGPLSRLVKRDGKTELEPYPLELPTNPSRPLQISELAESLDGSIWMNSSWGLIRRLPDERLIFYPFESPAESGSNSMVVARNGMVWLTVGDKVHAMLPEPLESITGGEKLILRDFIPSQRLVFTAGKEVQLPKRGGEIFEYMSDRETTFVENSYSKRLVETSDGTIWISAENVLFEVSNGFLQVQRSTDGLPAVMSRMAEDSVGNLWIGGQRWIGSH
ncbi:MAG: hypothetical protein PSX80_03015 [bacterium]|nr:hypothetical protein [bacterium]